LVIEIGLDTTILRTPFFGQIHAGEHLDARDDRSMQRFWNDVDVVYDTVDAETDQRSVAFRFDMNIACVLIKCVIKKKVDSGYHVLVGPLDFMMAFKFKKLFQIPQIYRR